MPRCSCSFSQDANEALRASVIFLLVPGVSGGTCAGMSAINNKYKRLLLYKVPAAQKKKKEKKRRQSCPECNLRYSFDK